MCKIPAFSADEMFHICNGSEELAKFDLSSISQSCYEKFFGGLPNILYKRVLAVEFRADLAAGNMGKLSKRETALVEDSIYQSGARYIQYLMKVLRVILPRTHKLESLTLSNIPIPDVHIIVLFQTIRDNTSLTSLCFENVPIRDKNLALLLTFISPYRYKELRFRHSGLTSRVFMKIYKFLKRQPRTEDEVRWMLKIFDVSGCKFSQKEAGKMKELIDRQREANKWRKKAAMKPLSASEEGEMIEEEDFFEEEEEEEEILEIFEEEEEEEEEEVTEEVSYETI